MNDFNRILNSPEILPYRQIMGKKRLFLFFKRLFDFTVSLVLLVILSPLMLILCIAVAAGSPGPVFFLQDRVTKNGRVFKIIKFRTMVRRAPETGPQVTVNDDSRITSTGRFLRRTHLDELPQLINVLAGDMSFVGTRPEVPRYVERYTAEMAATLLMRAGITSRASIAYSNEAELIASAGDADEVYVNEILPLKMKYNLEYFDRMSVSEDISIMFSTFIQIFK